MAKTKLLRDFVRYTGDKRDLTGLALKDKTGIVIRNENTGGVFRGHVDLWFGGMNADSRPDIMQVLVDDCEPIDPEEIPFGKT